jgi:hypothetical protein
MENLLKNLLIQILAQNYSSLQAKPGVNPTAKSNAPAKSNFSSAAANLKNNADKYIPNLVNTAISDITDTFKTGKEWTKYFKDLSRYTSIQNSIITSNETFKDGIFSGIERGSSLSGTA